MLVHRLGRLQNVATLGAHEVVASAEHVCLHRVWKRVCRDILASPSELCVGADPAGDRDRAAIERRVVVAVDRSGAVDLLAVEDDERALASRARNRSTLRFRLCLISARLEVLALQETKKRRKINDNKWDFAS